MLKVFTHKMNSKSLPIFSFLTFITNNGSDISTEIHLGHIHQHPHPSTPTCKEMHSYTYFTVTVPKVTQMLTIVNANSKDAS